MNFDSIKDSLIAEAERAGLAEYEVYFMESSDMSAETLKEEISSFSSGVRGGVSFRCVVNGRMGSAASELLEEDEMRALVARAIENASYIENDDKAILFAGSDEYARVDLPKGETLDAAALKRIALDVQKNTYAADGCVSDGTQSGVFTSRIETILQNSHGLYLSNCVSMSGTYVQAVVNRDGEAQEEFGFCLGTDATELAGLSVDTVREAIDKIGARTIDSGKYDVIFSGKQMRALLSAFTSVFSAKQAQLGLSLLKGREGEQIAAPCVTLVDDPMREGCPMQTPFDGEGVATYRKHVIENGTLNTLLYDLTTADRAGSSSTGNGQRISYDESPSIRPYSFYFEAGEKSEQALREQMGDGLYVTELKGLHAGCSAVAGDFSLESAGFWVRDGKLCEAVKSFTVAGNFFELLKKVEAFADTVHFGIPSGFTVYGSPDVLIRQMSVAGK